MGGIVVITGGSSGIGLSTAEALVSAGCTVYNISRRDFTHPNIVHIKADVSNEDDVICAINKIIDAAGHIDILINCAGFGISGATEFTTLSEAKGLFDVNFFGKVNVTGAVIPHMRAAGSGRIINISSVAAVIPIPFQTFYSASKAAVNSYTMALANELRPFGIEVSAVMPGDTQTGFTASRKKSLLGNSIYSDRIERSVSTMERDEQSGTSPVTMGKYIANVALKPSVKVLYTPGLNYKVFVVLAKVLPASLLNYVVGLIYSK